MGNCICIIPCLHRKTNDLPLYQLTGTYKAKVVDVYDGDTITIVLLNKCSFEKHKLRLYGIDTPEMKPLRNDPNRDEIKKNALISKNKLSELVLNKIIEVDLIGNEKYGRLLGTVFTINYCSRTDINQYMIDNNYAYAYFGGTKQSTQI